MTTAQKNQAYLNMLSDVHYNVLFDHTYNTITIYESSNGLDPENDLGDDYEEWLTDDLFTYIEMMPDELTEFIDTFVFDVVWDTDYFQAETHGY